MKEVEPTAILLSPTEPAKRLGVPSSKLLIWYHDGRIPAEIAEGAVYRFEEFAVVEAIESRIASLAEFSETHHVGITSAPTPKTAGPIQFQEKMDAATAARRTSETKEALMGKNIPVPSAPVKSSVLRLTYHAMII